jgi:hypothetical protein
VQVCPAGKETEATTGPFNVNAALLIASKAAAVAVPAIVRVTILPPDANLIEVALTNSVHRPSVLTSVIPLLVTGIEINFTILFFVFCLCLLLIVCLFIV